MALELLKDANRVIGIKQVTKAVKRGIAQEVYIADDADARVIAPLIQLCEERGTTCNHVETMKGLGEACAIEVGAAAAATIKTIVC